MGLFSWAEGKAKKLRWYDFSVLKLSMLAFGVWLAIIWPALINVNHWIFFVIFIVGWVYLLYRMLR